MQAHDLLGQGETDTGTSLFGGEKRYKDLLNHFLLNAPSVIDDLHNGKSLPIRPRHQFDFRIGLIRCRRYSVFAQIYQDLFDENRIGR